MKIALLGYGKMGEEIQKIAVKRGHEIVRSIIILKTGKEMQHVLNRPKWPLIFQRPTVWLKISIIVLM